MFFNPRLRFILIFSLFAAGVVALLLGFGPTISILSWGFAILLLLGYFLFGHINGALFALKAGKIEQAEKYLAATHKVDWLLASHRAYYFFCQGLIAIYKSQEKGLDQKERFAFLEKGEQQLLQAIDLGMRRKAEKAMSYLNLAHIAYYRGEKLKAEEYAQLLAEHLTEDLHLKKGYEDLQKAIAKMP